VVHRPALDAIRRRVTRATRPTGSRPAGAPPAGGPDAAGVPGAWGRAEPDELAAMRIAGGTASDDRATRAARSAAAYLEVRRERLRRELRGHT
jgi:hypothetical protein